MRRAALAGRVGFLAGVGLWWALVRLLPVSGRAVAEARALGLQSFTILRGYDPSQEVRAWALGCLIVPVLAFAARRWAGGAPPRLRRLPGPAWAPALAMLTVAVLHLWRPNFATGPSPWGSFGLLAEEGVYLGAVQAVRDGRVPYAEVAFPYGPFLLDSLDLWLRAVGDSIVQARWWAWLLHAAGFVTLAATAALAAGSAWAAAGAALIFAVIAPLSLPNLNAVALRPALALLPGALWMAAARPRVAASRRRGAIAGATAAAALGASLSFEIAAPALAGLLLAVGLERPRRGELAWGLAAGTAVAAALSARTILAGGGPALIDQILSMLRWPALGYQALPYPDSLGLLADAAGRRGAFPPSDTATALWAAAPPMVIWAGLAVGLEGLRRTAPAPDRALLVTAVSAAVLWRAALGRSDLYHLAFYGAVPLAVVGAQLALRFAAAAQRPVVPLVLAGVAAWSLAATDAPGRVAFPLHEEQRLAAEAGVPNALEPRPLDLERAGPLQVLPRLGGQLDQWSQAVAALPDLRRDGLWVYPSEATLYFLFDVSPPTRYLWAYDAATPSQQRQAIAELDQRRPRWLLRAQDTFPIDHIPQARLVPLIEAYIDEHYVERRRLQGAILLERR